MTGEWGGEIGTATELVLTRCGAENSKHQIPNKFEPGKFQIRKTVEFPELFGICLASKGYV